MARQQWFVDKNWAKVNFGTAVVDGLATEDIFHLDLLVGATYPDVTLWAGSGTAVTDSAVTDATALQDAGAPPSHRAMPAISSGGTDAQTGTSYTLVTTDINRTITLTNASAIGVTIPASSTQRFPIGARSRLVQMGAGQVTVAAASGAAVHGTPGVKTRAQYSVIEVEQVALDVWIVTLDNAA